MKIAIIIAYFGKLPEYIQLFLDSCKLNYGFEWLIFSDDDTTYNYPSNVHLIKMNFGECKKLIQSKFDFEITLSKPQKLCAQGRIRLPSGRGRRAARRIY